MNFPANCSVEDIESHSYTEVPHSADRGVNHGREEEIELTNCPAYRPSMPNSPNGLADELDGSYAEVTRRDTALERRRVVENAQHQGVEDDGSEMYTCPAYMDKQS